ncbi:MAG: xanthine dehydrogenase family protein subunit M [Acidobacteria bacterium]|nr:xanthine dehydrogenase family protein subunit M [Acidobacteriota bacterium]
MIAQNFDYTAPASLAEALSLLASGEAKPLAGGMSLIPMMKLRLAAPDQVVDLGRIPELNYIRHDGGRVRIGATATHHQVATSTTVRSQCPLLAATAAQIGDVQVRNMGTIGGSVAHADPAADYPAALLALGAEVTVANAGGSRTLSIEDFLVDTFTTALEPGEIITEISVPAGGGSGCHYQKMLQPASGFAIVGIAVQVTASGGVIASARVGVTGLTGKAFRAHGVEAALVGKSAAGIAEAVAGIADGVDANSDIHASAGYRCQMARVHAGRAVAAALAKA